MSSNKRKDEIESTVEGNILDAVTRIQKDESSFNPYESSVQSTEYQSPIGSQGDSSLNSIWKVVKIEKDQEKPTESEPSRPPPQQSQQEVKKTEAPAVGDMSLPLSPEKPPSPSTENPVLQEDHLHTIPLADMESYSAPAFVVPTSSWSTGTQTPLDPVQMRLHESEHIKVAQNRIEALEKEIERLRIENERLASVSEVFQRRYQDAAAAKQEIEKKQEFNEARFSEERISLKNSIEQRDRTIKELKVKIEDLELRLTTDVRKSRTRERELENRLELVRLEKISLVGSKDEIILDLKRQVDQLNHELGNYRKKSAELTQTIESNQEQFRRTVRALRLALTNLEVNEQIGGRSKKAD